MTAIVINAGGTLTLHDDVTFNGGRIDFFYPVLAGDDQPDHHGQWRRDSRKGAPRVPDAGPPSRQNHQCAHRGVTPAQLTTATAQGAETPFQILGYVDIQAKMINNAQVVVDRAADVLRLSTYEKTGAGEWICDEGQMVVDVDCTGLTGDVFVRGGVFDVNQSFCTSGSCSSPGKERKPGRRP